jgi:hypothetical protein
VTIFCSALLPFRRSALCSIAHFTYDLDWRTAKYADVGRRRALIHPATCRDLRLVDNIVATCDPCGQRPAMEETLDQAILIEPIRPQLRRSMDQRGRDGARGRSGNPVAPSSRGIRRPRKLRRGTRFIRVLLRTRGTSASDSTPPLFRSTKLLLI